MAAIANATADLWVDDANLLHKAHVQNCMTTEELPWLQRGQISYAFATRGDTERARDLQVKLSKAVSLFLLSPGYVELEDRHFEKSNSCSRSNVDELTKVDLKMMTGLFLYSGILAGIGLLWAFLKFTTRMVVGKVCPSLAEEEEKAEVRVLDEVVSDPFAAEEVMLRALMGGMQSLLKKGEPVEVADVTLVARPSAKAIANSPKGVEMSELKQRSPTSLVAALADAPEA